MNAINISKNDIRRCFNKAAITYDKYSHVQQFVGKKLLDLLCQYKTQTDRVIDLGCGSGLVTQQLACAMSYKSFHAIDIAHNLLMLARKRLQSHQIKVYEQDFDNLTSSNELFDLAFSNMALHWSLTFEQTLLTIQQNLLLNGIIAFSIPVAGTFLELNADSINHFYLENTIFEWLSLAGFERVAYFVDSLTVKFDNFIDALNSIKKVGANSTLIKSQVALCGKSFLNQIAKVENLAVQPFSLTYRIGYFIARKV
ncbi:MAG: methyltransferase domain-containing protein [Gammaproteobacteria bacterium]